MTTSNRAEINKANSQHSTGPKTKAGKQKSSANALSHGLTSQSALMPIEDREAYQHHLEAYAREYNPKDATESDLVQSLADTSWRLNRVAALESKVLTGDTPLEAQTKALANLSMHSQRLSRQYEKTVTLLRQLQATRRAHESQELRNLLNIIDMFERKGEPYDPAEDGFVFSEAEINDAILARSRDILREEARDYAA